MTIFYENIERIVAVLSVVSAYFFGVKKDKADIFSTMQKSYKTFIDDFNLKYDVMSSQVTQMQKQIEAFQNNEETLRRVIQQLETKVSKLEKENRILKNRLTKHEKE